MFKSLKSPTIVALLISFFTPMSWGQDEPALKPYLLEKVTDHAFILVLKEDENSHFNFGIIVGDKGVTLINSGMHYHAKTIENAVRNVTAKPITRVINTNHDPYNHRGNEYFASKGASILSHEALRYGPGYFQSFFNSETSLDLGTETVTIYPTKAHSLGHSLIHIEKANILFMSDSYRTDWITTTGPHGLKGHIASIDLALSLSNDLTKVVTGGGGNIIDRGRAGLLKERSVREAFVRRVTELHGRGWSMDQIAEDREIDQLLKDSYPERTWSGKDRIEETIQTDLTSIHPIAEVESTQYLGFFQNTETQQQLEILQIADDYYARSESKFFFKLRPVTEDKMILLSVEGENYLTFERDDRGAISGLSSTISNEWYERYLPTTKWNKILQAPANP